MNGVVWSTPWSRRRAAEESDLCDPAQIRGDARAVLLELLGRTLNGPKPDQLRVELIASKRQSARLLSRKDEAAILFDLSQSIVLKRLFHEVYTDQPYDEAARILCAAAGLAVADESPALCSALLSITVPEQSEYLHGHADLLEHYLALKEFLPNLLGTWQSSLIDGYLFAHEVSHHLFQGPSKLMGRLQSGARSAFEFALNQVCYERHPEFEAIAQHGGALPKDPEALERLRCDLATRREHYEANRNHLVEEITCDAYALTMLMASHVQAWRPDTDDQNAILNGFMRLAQTFFLIVALSDLHQAMIQRAKLSLATGIESEKPGDIADMHFRKMALMYVIAEHAMVCIPSSQWSKEMLEHLLAQIVNNIIGVQKQAIDALVVIPTTRVVRATILAFERDIRTAQFPARGEQPWLGRLGVLFGERWPTVTFSDGVLQDLLGT
jgi:hypothetical protein